MPPPRGVLDRVVGAAYRHLGDTRTASRSWVPNMSGPHSARIEISSRRKETSRRIEPGRCLTSSWENRTGRRGVVGGEPMLLAS